MVERIKEFLRKLKPMSRANKARMREIAMIQAARPKPLWVITEYKNLLSVVYWTDVGCYDMIELKSWIELTEWREEYFRRKENERKKN